MINKNYVNIYSQAILSSSGLFNKGRKLSRYLILDFISTFNKKVENKFLRCLYLHYVFDDQIEQFEELIINLMELGVFVDTETLVKMLRCEKEIDGRYFHLSFDDGFKNNYTNAIPILTKYNIPCIFFVPTAIIGASWEVTKNYCIKTTHYGGVIEMLKWEELNEIVSLGFEVGSHTKRHPRLSSISHDFNLLQDEVLFSKNDIETNLDIECKYIAWPFGRHNDVDKVSLKMIESSGYNACFGAFRGTINKKKTDIYKIPRHEIDLQLPISHNKYFARGNMELEFNF